MTQQEQEFHFTTEFRVKMMIMKEEQFHEVFESWERQVNRAVTLSSLVTFDELWNLRIAGTILAARAVRFNSIPYASEAVRAWNAMLDLSIRFDHEASR